MPRSSEWMRWADRSVLAAAALGLALTNRRRSLPITPRRIGIIQPNAIGDTFIASGAVAAIAARYPDAELLVFHGANNAPAVHMIAAPLVGVCCNFSRPLQALRILKAADLDLVVDQTPWPHLTAILARLSAPCAVGFSPAGSGRGRLFDIPIPHRSDQHELDNLAAMARVFGAADPYRMQLRVSDYGGVRQLPLDRMVLCQLAAGGTRAAEKAWPVDYWAALCSRLIDERYIPAFTGIASDRKFLDPLLERLGPRAKSTTSLCGEVPLEELGDLLRRAHAVVTVDTSVLHLAGAVDARVFGLHGPTRSYRWGARSSRGRSFDSPHPDAGYIAYGTETHPNALEVMKALTPDFVLPIIFKTLQEAAIYAKPASA